MTSSARVKICGITSVNDAIHATHCGVDAIGLVFYPPSPRYLSDLGLAREIALSVGPYVNVVALFVDQAERTVESVLASVPITTLQFHGNEDIAFCERFERPYYKAIRMHCDVRVEQKMLEFSSASGLLLDTYKKGVPGGTGDVFDWRRVPREASNVVLAGGLNPINVAEAIKIAQPYAVDVSGGVESAPGIKDPAKVKAFVDTVKNLEQ